MTANRTSSTFRRLLAPAICVVTFIMPFAVWYASTGNPTAYFTAIVPPGQTLFVFSKLLALLAIVMMWFQAMSALAKDTPALHGFPVLRTPQHMAFGIATFAIVLAHVSLFVIASTLRTQHAAWNLLLPTFDQGYYRIMLGLGAIAFWFLVLSVVAGGLRRRGLRIARWMHRTVFIVFALAFLHGISVGSETRFGLMKYVYAFMGLSLGTAVVSRVWLHLSQRSFAARPSASRRSARPRREPNAY